MAVVKSNAYGHGLIETAKIFLKNGASRLAVDSLEEGRTLREGGVKAPILVIGFVPPDLFSLARKLDLAITFYHSHFVKYNLPKIHIKIESGMHRQGLDIVQLPVVLRKIPREKVEGAYTHFAFPTDPKRRQLTELQLSQYKKALSILEEFGIKEPIRHTSSSAAAILYPEANFDFVRPGIMLYGLYSSEAVKKKVQVKPALSWKVKIAQVKEVSKGGYVGYGLGFRAPRQMKVAVLLVGYWDGYDRLLSNNGEVVIGGRRCPVIGRVCMNMIMADVSKIRARCGDTALLLGRGVTADYLAGKMNTINYEVVTRINPLLPRKYV